MEAKGEKLLQDLASHEQILVGQVEDARKQALDIVQRAKDEAAKLISKSKEDGSVSATARLKDAEAEAENIRQGILEAAKSEVNGLEKRAQDNIDEAIKTVLDKVIP